MKDKIQQALQASRRDIVKKIATISAAAALPIGFPAIVRGASDTIRIGHLTPRTGFLGQIGEYGFKGINLAVEDGTVER